MTSAVPVLDDAFVEWLRAERRWFHAHPELRFEERETSKRIAWYLDEWGLAPRRGLAETGVVGLLDRGDGPCLMLRADMDGLPVTEKGRHPHRSLAKGRMHACGHDVHMAVLLAVARILAGTEGRELVPAGRVLFVFQPGEEGGAGAERMLRDGLFEPIRPDMALACHVSPELPVGTVGVFPRHAMAAAERVEFVVRGRGGHAAYPHRCKDPVPAAAALISALQTVVSRRVPARDAAILSLCSLKASETDNVISDEVRIGGTLRFLDPAVGDIMHEAVDEIVRGIGKAHGTEARWQVHMAYPPVVNDEGASAFLRAAATEALGESGVRDIPSELVGEDFAWFAQEVPACMWRLGTRGESEDSAEPLHSNRFDVDEDALAVGVKVWLHCIRKFFEKERSAGGRRKPRRATRP